MKAATFVPGTAKIRSSRMAIPFSVDEKCSCVVMNVIAIAEKAFVADSVNAVAIRNHLMASCRSQISRDVSKM